MDKDYPVASLPDSCVDEINKLQEELTEETRQEIVLVAYKCLKAEK